MITPSPEIEAIVVRWLAAHSGKQARPLTRMLSASDHLRYLGSAPEEYWAGELVRQGLADHLLEVPNWSARDAVVEGFEQGNVGWAIWQGQVKFDGRDSELDVRFSFVLTLEDGLWHVVQIHCSMATPNAEFHGMEQTAFADLIEAARNSDQEVGGEDSAVIMFTDVANSTEIANAMNDRDWAVAIGRQLDLQATAIARNDGVLVKTLGDGSMSSFGAASSAMRAAVAMQTATAGEQTGPRLKLRVGIHAGDVIHKGDDFFGTVVNKAARITGIAQPNEILVSDVARAMAGERDEFNYTDPVNVALRGIEGQHIICGLNWAD